MSLLHVRGGVSITGGFTIDVVRSSPRPWRCFVGFVRDLHRALVFSTSVEVFLKKQDRLQPGEGLLHVRGGVSKASFLSVICFWSSPRPWRCFYLGGGKTRINVVFSTSVEVFLVLFDNGRQYQSLLHVRGGVSVCLRHKIISGMRVRKMDLIDRPC